MNLPPSLPRRGFLARLLALWTSGAWLGALGRPSPAEAIEADPPYLGEIRLFAGNYAPTGWAFCEGQILPIDQNDSLFFLIGTTYGGDGQTTFALPDLRGRAPIHTNASSYALGEIAGAEEVTLGGTQIPVHSHTAGASSALGTSASPAGCVPARNAAGVPSYGLPTAKLSTAALLPAGSSSPHNNMQPYLGIHYIIALEGTYPTQ